MAVSDVSDRAAIISAMEEYERVGEAVFLAEHGYEPARRYVLHFMGRSYPSKAIVGVAHGYQFPGRGALRSEDFRGGDAMVVPLLRRLGFDVRDLRDRGDLWNDDELRAAVNAYHVMYELERSGKHVVKSRVIAELRAGPLASRSAGSVSRRMNNISAVLDELGMGHMRGYAPLRNVGSNVRPKLERFIRDAWGQPVTTKLLAEAVPVRVVPIGAINQESYDIPGLSPRRARQVEQALLHRYEAVVREHGRTIVAHAYEGRLRCDAFDETLNVLIEAKAVSSREFARMAVGQLLDYRRYEPGTPNLAVLLPGRPAAGTFDFLMENGIAVIWEAAPGRFDDSAGGALS